jgi:hypothetical protein
VLTRLVIVAALIGVTVVATYAYRRRRSHDEQLGSIDAATGDERWPVLPAELASPGQATWVIFTTPLCVSCDAVRADLVAHDPTTRVLTVDATERPDLSDRYGVRRAPTTILAAPDGRITERLVGPEAVRDHLRAGSSRSSLAG